MLPVLLGKIKNNTEKIENVLPEVTTLDNGKLLTVVNGIWGKANAPSSLPNVSASDNGKILSVVGGQWTAANAGGGVLVVRADSETGVLDKTWREINAAGFAVLRDYILEGSISLLVTIGEGENIWGLMFYNLLNESAHVLTFVSDSADGYPHYVSD